METDELVKMLKKSKYYKNTKKDDISDITEAHPELAELIDDSISGAEKSVKKLKKIIDESESMREYVKILVEVAIRRAKIRGDMTVEKIYSSFLRKI